MKNSSPIPHTFCAPTLNKQKGAAIILLVFALILVVLAYTVRTLNSNDLQARENAKTFQALAEAKAALISWSVSHPYLPGLMPYPDRNADPKGYDGLSDCPGGTTLPSHLIGRLPWKGGDYNDCNNLLGGLGKEFKDASNEPLWYAVSENLVHIYSPSGDPIINPNIIDNPPYGAWLTVYDKNGQLISDKVAAVIIAPGVPLNDQDRSSGIAGTPDYLDSFNLQAGGGAKSNRTYSAADEDFYMGEDSRSVRSDNTTYQQPYYFNDKLVYITIDELMAEIEKRATGEARKALQKYYASQGSYPHAAKLGATTNYSCDGSSLKGFLPTESKTTTGCSCTWGATRTCTCPFTNVSSISFKRGSGTFSATNVSGACSRSTTSTSTCACTGAGYCKDSAGTQTFSCTSAGACTSTISGTYTFSGTFNASSGICTIPTVAPSGCTSTTAVSCTSTSTGTGVVLGTFAFNACTDQPFNSATTNSQLPAWFTDNKWQDYIYYDATSGLTVSAKTGVQALLVSSGSPIITSPFAASKGSAQSRPSCSLAEYLDSVENTNNDGIFDAVNTPRKSTYNDQMFIVAP